MNNKKILFLNRERQTVVGGRSVQIRATASIASCRSIPPERRMPIRSSHLRNGSIRIPQNGFAREQAAKFSLSLHSFDVLARSIRFPS